MADYPLGGLGHATSPHRAFLVNLNYGLPIGLFKAGKREATKAGLATLRTEGYAILRHDTIVRDLCH